MTHALRAAYRTAISAAQACYKLVFEVINLLVSTQKRTDYNKVTLSLYTTAQNAICMTVVSACKLMKSQLLSMTFLSKLSLIFLSGGCK